MSAKVKDWVVLIVNLAFLISLVLWNSKRLRNLVVSFAPAIAHQYLPEEKR
jgi:hypothetical protein